MTVLSSTRYKSSIAHFDGRLFVQTLRVALTRQQSPPYQLSKCCRIFSEWRLHIDHLLGKGQTAVRIVTVIAFAPPVSKFSFTPRVYSSFGPHGSPPLRQAKHPFCPGERNTSLVSRIALVSIDTGVGYPPSHDEAHSSAENKSLLRPTYERQLPTPSNLLPHPEIRHGAGLPSRKFSCLT